MVDATAKKTSATDSTAKQTAAKKTSAKKTSAKKTSAKKTSAKKSPAKKSPAKKASAEKSPAKKSSRGSAPRAEAPRARGESSQEESRAGSGGGSRVARAARAAVLDLTGKRPEAVTGLERTDDGWTVEVEVLELERIPSTTDVLGTYQVTLDGDGELQGCRRVHRYLRGSPRDE